MVKSGLIFFTFLSLIISAKGNIVSDLLNDFLNVLKNGIQIEKINLGPDIGNISKLDLTLDGYHYEVNGSKLLDFSLWVNASEILINGDYDIKNLTIPIPGLFPIRGKGKINISLKENNFQLGMQARPNFHEIKIKILNFIIFVDKSKVNFENLLYDPELSDYLNTLISNILPKFVKIISDNGQSVLEPLLQYYGNEVYKCITHHMNDLENCLKNIKPPKTLFFDINDNLKLIDFVKTLTL